jgi:hypothetical protein
MNPSMSPNAVAGHANPCQFLIITGPIPMPVLHAHWPCTLSIGNMHENKHPGLFLMLKGTLSCSFRCFLAHCSYLPLLFRDPVPMHLLNGFITLNQHPMLSVYASYLFLMHGGPVPKPIPNA